MKKIKPTAAAGKFYTDNKDELLSQMNSFIVPNAYVYKSRAIIVPHAGYVFSGKLASQGFQQLDKNVKNVFIIAPPHYVAVKSDALSGFDKWTTPFGEIDVNQEINKELITRFGCEIQDGAFEEEHSAEVQVPFIQKFLPHVKIVPILAAQKFEKISKIIAHYWQNSENAFVISSDLSHFYSSLQARKLDGITADMIESKDIEKFTSDQACGSIGVCGLVHFASGRGYSLIRIGLINSGDVTGNNTRVVGYGSWMLYEGPKNNLIQKEFPNIAIDVCKNSILAGLDGEIPACPNVPEVFHQSGACFVTLEKKGVLRGCIGSIIAHRPLIEDLIKNAQSAAFSDPRFPSLRKDEFKDLSISVSLLSEPEKMHFTSETDLLNQIKPYTDGIIIKERNYQAVYLPSVWEQLPDKVLFLKSLKAKAGLPENYFSQTFEAYRFVTDYIKG